MDNMNQFKWASNLQEANNPYLDDFELFANERQKMDVNDNRYLNSVMKAIKEYQQQPNISVRVYTNCLKANMKIAGWSIITHEVVWYNMPWVGLKHALRTNIRLWICSAKVWFDMVNQLLDSSVALEFVLDNMMLRQQPQQR